jgi:hypothetical protein
MRFTLTSGNPISTQEDRVTRIGTYNTGVTWMKFVDGGDCEVKEALEEVERKLGWDKK